MQWNKKNPRFRRSAQAGSRPRKSGKIFKGVGQKLHRLLGRFKTGQRPLPGGEANPVHRPQPPVPAELFEDLKIAVPKSRPLSGSRNPRRRRRPSEAATPPPQNSAIETRLESPAPTEETAAAWASDDTHTDTPSGAGKALDHRSDSRTALTAEPGPIEIPATASEATEEERPARYAPFKAPRPLVDFQALKKAGSKAESPLAEGLLVNPVGQREERSPKTAPGAPLTRIMRPESEISVSDQAGSTHSPIRPEKKRAGGKSENGRSPAPSTPVKRPPKVSEGGVRARRGPEPASNPAESNPQGVEPGLERPSKPLARISPLPAPPGETAENPPGSPVVPGQASKPALWPRDQEPIEVFSPQPGPPKAAKNKPGDGARNLKRWSLAAALVLLAAGGVIGGVYFFQDSAPPSAKVAKIPAASLPKVAPLSPGFYERYAQELENADLSEVTISAGSSLGKALESVGLGTRHKVGSIIECLTSEGGVAVVRPGAVVRAFWGDSEKNELKRLEYHPSTGGAPIVVMARPDGGFWRYNLSSPLLTINAAREGSITSSLWEAGSKAGLDANVIMSLAEILASEVDFLTDIKKGDEFQVLYSRDYSDGKAQGTPIIDMVSFKSRTKTLEYYRYVNSQDKVGYYDSEGRSSVKTFFVSPLQYKRISSHFTMTRMHPIHKVVRPHQGVDYAAPTGTPVSTVSDGTVIFCGWNGGYGRLVTIKHDSTYTTMYAHLSSFAPGLKKGSTVKQGDLIGRVGATGTATGPHLDFRLKKNGKFIDPVPELAKQEGKKLDSPKDRQAFVEVRDRIRVRMKEQLAAAKSGV